MGNDFRTALLNYCELFNGKSDKVGLTVKLEKEKGSSKLHPMIFTSKAVLEGIFNDEILPTQDFFAGSLKTNKHLVHLH